MSRLALDFLEIDRALDREIDRLAAIFLGGLQDDIVPRWRRRIVRLLDGLDRQGIGLKPTTRNQQAARQADAAIRSGLAQSGYTDHVQETFDQFTEIAKIAARGLRKGGLDPRLRPFDTNMLATYRGLKLLEFERLGGAVASEVSAVIGKAVVAGQSLTELVVEVQELLQTFTHNARTLFETAAAEFAQTMTLLRGGADQARVYLYSGPIDMRIRAFCLGRVGRVYSRGAIDKMDNGQLANTFLSRGGYNCRHQWRDVSSIPELARLADTNTIVHEQIAGQVAAMQGYLRIAGRQKGARTA